MLLNSIPFANLRKKTYIAKFLTFYRGQLLFDHATPFGWGHGRPDRASRRGLDARRRMKKHPHGNFKL